jgi:hypothetical protein
MDAQEIVGAEEDGGELTHHRAEHAGVRSKPLAQIKHAVRVLGELPAPGVGLTSIMSAAGES